MTGLIPSGGTTEISALEKLLTLLSDPKAAQAKLTELKQAAEDARVVIDTAATAAAQVAAQKKALDERQVKFDEDEKHLEIDADNMSSEIVAIMAREDVLKTKEGDLEAREARFTGRMSQDTADLEAREQNFAARVIVHDTAMAQREKTASEREAGAQAAFDEAQAVKQDYERRITKLNAAMGAA